MQLDGKVAIISGGGTGIGAATARVFRERGAKVVVSGRRAALIEAIAGEVGGVAVVGDVTDPQHCAACVAAAIGSFGALDIVVANAGTGVTSAIDAVKIDDWQRTIDVNLTGPMLLVRAALPSLLERDSSSVVLVASVNGLVNTPQSAAYDASKAALISLTRSIAIDYGPRGLRANAVCPGWVRTPMGDVDMDAVARAHSISRERAYELVSVNVPLRRVAEADEIARGCAFLASDDASFVTGTTLVVDGGGLAVDVTGIALGTSM